MTTVSRTLSIGQEHQLLMALEKAGLTASDAQAVIDSKRNVLATQLVTQIRGEQPTDGITLGRYPITVDYKQTVEELLALRQWTYVNPNITSTNFPRPRKMADRVVDEAVMELIKFEEWGTTADRERQLDAMGLELPDMHHQLSFTAHSSNDWDGQLIVFLGASWVRPPGGRGVGYLDGEGGVRDCRLSWGDPDNRWAPRYIFAGVRKDK
jgi:hypothetical protein